MLPFQTSKLNVARSTRVARCFTFTRITSLRAVLALSRQRFTIISLHSKTIGESVISPADKRLAANRSTGPSGEFSPFPFGGEFSPIREVELSKSAPAWIVT